MLMYKDGYLIDLAFRRGFMNVSVKIIASIVVMVCNTECIVGMHHPIDFPCDMRPHSSLLYDAVKTRNIDAIKKLLQRGCDVNDGGYDHESPLNLAAEKGYLGAVEILLDNGADINANRSTIDTPLLQALRYGQLDVAAYLIRRGADVRGALSAIFLYLFIYKICRFEVGSSYYAFIEFLVQHGAGQPDKQVNGLTALHEALFWSCCSNKEVLFELLICSGADLYAVDSNKQTARERALQFGFEYKEAAEILARLEQKYPRQSLDC